MPMIELVLATELDLPTICALGAEVNALHVSAWPQIFRAAETPSQDADFWRDYLGKPDAIIVLAKLNSQTIGMATAQLVTETASLLQPMTFCRIGSVCVTEAERGKGVGHQLMQYVETWAASCGASDVRLNVWKFNARAVSLYEELGYSVRSLFMGKMLPEA